MTFEQIDKTDVTMNSNERLLKKLQGPKYRDVFIAANVGIQIAMQLNALRLSRGKSQDKLANEIGMNQATISQMEKPEYRKYNIGTLIRFAQHYKIALDVRFVSIADYVKTILNQTPDTIAPLPFGEPSAIPPGVEIPEMLMTQQTLVPQEPSSLPIPRGPRSSSQEKSDLLDLINEVHPDGIV